jgi:hypothetical protein
MSDRIILNTYKGSRFQLAAPAINEVDVVHTCLYYKLIGKAKTGSANRKFAGKWYIFASKIKASSRLGYRKKILFDFF